MSDIYYIISYLFIVLLGGMGVGSPWPNVNLILSLLVVEGGSTPIPFHFNNYLFQAFQDKKEMYQKITINRDIGILSFTFVKTWEQNVNFLWLSIACNVTYLKFLFWGSYITKSTSKIFLGHFTWGYIWHDVKVTWSLTTYQCHPVSISCIARQKHM